MAAAFLAAAIDSEAYQVPEEIFFEGVFMDFFRIDSQVLREEYGLVWIRVS